MNRRRFIKIAALGAASGLVATTAAEGAPRTVRLTRHRVPWPGTRRKIRVAHLTDLHVGWGTPRRLLEQAVGITRKLRPDLVVMTGDYLNRTLKHRLALESLVARLPRPCVATLGNHDHWSGAAGVASALQRHGVTVLRNASRTVPLGVGVGLPVVGVDDGVTDHHRVDRAFAGLGRDVGRALVLSHDPDLAPKIAARGGRLTLSGHTHGGQLSVPVLTRAVLHATGHRFIAGWYDLGEGRRLYVNAGVGSSVMRVRVGREAAPEVALIELVPT